VHEGGYFNPEPDMSALPEEFPPDEGEESVQPN
jgi:hypothetical protein